MHDENKTARSLHSPASREFRDLSARATSGRTDVPYRRRLEECTQHAFRDPRSIALYLDMDGTLLELAATPEGVTIPGGLVELLGRLAEGLGGALAIVTGRRIVEVDNLLAPLRLAASGVHGVELRVSSSSSLEIRTPDLSEQFVRALQELAGQAPGAFAEPKGSGLAIHYRLAPEAESAIAQQLQRFHEDNPGTFDIWPGRKVFEVIPKGFSKGTAISALANLPPFKDRIPIMIGDDVGDEPAFAAAEALGGYGLRVAGENFDKSRSDFNDPRAVLTWLEAFAQRLDQSSL